MNRVPGPQTEEHEALGSVLVWVEFAGLLVRKLRFSSDGLATAQAMLDEAEQIADAPDPADDNGARLVAAASAAGAGLFVTGDKRVLDWRRPGKMRIVSPREARIILFAPHLKHRA